MSSPSLYAWRKRSAAALRGGCHLPELSLLAITVQNRRAFEIGLRSGNRLRLTDSITTEPVAALLRALEAP